MQIDPRRNITKPNVPLTEYPQNPPVSPVKAGTPSWAPAVFIAIAGIAAYANAFFGPFVFDDVSSIVDNPTIRSLSPLREALSPPTGWGLTVSGRPILNLSFAINHAIGGLDVRSYHAANLLIHLLAGLTLFGLVRRTLLRPSLAPRWAERAVMVAAVTAGLWTLHPLQTESVTYIVQRAESLMGLFFLLTLYLFVRAEDSPRPLLWRSAAFVSCLLGVGTKEVAALTPILVLLYDRTFLSGSFLAAWQRHRWSHLVLASTWIPQAFLLAATGGNRGGTVGFDVGTSWSGYWLTQFEAVTRYLGLAVWPHPLVFDYGKVAPPSHGAVLVWALPVVVAAIATLVALRRWPVAGFLGAAFFLLLAPTSVVPNAQQMIVEHRMYLPLAAVIACVVGALAVKTNPRAFIAGGIAVALAAGFVTSRRNAVYASEQLLWEDTLAKRPANARAHNNLGLALYRRGELDRAISHFAESKRLDASDAHTHHNLGLALTRTGRLAEAAPAFLEAVQILPHFFNAQTNLGMVYTQLGRAEEALSHFAAALNHDPAPAETHFQFGVALASLGRWAEAAQQYAAAVSADPRHAQAHSNWGVALTQLNDSDRAIAQFQSALRLKPELADTHFNLALVLTGQRQSSAALFHYSEAVRLDPQHADAQKNLGILLVQSGKVPDGIVHLERALALRPELPEAHTNLALALLTAGRFAEAISSYESAMRLRPTDPRAYYNLGYALLSAQQVAPARSRLEEALKIDPAFTPARELLQQLRANGSP